ncbi:MAG: tetratricopeptide repeat protein [Phycisphaerales bacterium]|nr:MAG: tetratricopeptide repeat protein [Phycisphaerales bacterium]
MDVDRAYLDLDAIPPPLALEPANPKAATQPSRPTVRRMQAARELIAEQRYTEAIAELEKALRYDPAYGPLYRSLGAASRRSGALGRASSFLDKALMLDPTDAEAHYHRAMVAAEGGEQEEALRQLRLAWMCPHTEEGRIPRALIALELGKRLEEAGYLVAAAQLYGHFEKARAAWKPIELSDPEVLDFVSSGPETAAQRIGRINERLGRLDQAREAYAHALDYAPDDVVVQTGSARLLLRMGRRHEARRLTRKLLAAVSSDREWEEVRRLYLDTGHDKELIEDLRLVAAQPNPPVQVLEGLFEAIRQEADAAEAQSILNKLIEARGDDSGSYVRAMQFFASRGDGERALRLLADTLRNRGDRLALLKRAVDEFGRNREHARIVVEAAERRPARLTEADAAEAGALYLASRLAVAGGREESARRWLEMLIRQQPDFGPAHSLLGDILVREGRWGEAIDVIQRGFPSEEALNTSGEAHWVLARAHQGLDHTDEAESHYEAAVSLCRDDAEPAFQLGQLLERNGQVLRAQRQYKAALAVNPGHEGAHEALVRNFLMQHETHLAREQLRSMQQALDDNPAVQRCRALWDYHEEARSSRRSRREVTREYVTRLNELAEHDPTDTLTRLDLALALCEPLRDFKRSAEVLDEALGTDPHNEQGLELRVLVHRRNLEFEQAATLLERMLARHPNREIWKWELAQVHLTLQDYDAAAALFAGMLAKLQEDANPAQVRRALLYTYVLAGKPDAAADAVREWEEQAEAEDEDAAVSLFTMRESLIGQLIGSGDDSLALELSEEWYGEAPGDPAARAALYSALLAPANRLVPPLEDEEAVQGIERAKVLLAEWLEDDPDSVDLNLRMISLLAVEGQHQAAVELARNWRAASERQSRLWEVLARTLMGAGEHEEAVRLYRDQARATQDGSDFQSAALAMIQAGRFEEAERYLLNLEERLRDGPGPRSELAYMLYTCYLYWDKSKLAEQQLQQVLAETELPSYEPGSGLAARYFGACNDLGYMWADQGKNLKEAERMIREAVSSAPRQAAYLDSLGWVRYKRGDLQGAVKWLEWAAQARLPRDAIILDHLGDAYWRQRRREEAVAAWREAVDLLEVEAARGDQTPEEQRSLEGMKRKLEQVEQGSEPAIAEIADDAAVGQT